MLPKHSGLKQLELECATSLQEALPDATQLAQKCRLVRSAISSTPRLHTLARQMADIIDLTASPPPEIIEISSDQENTSPGRRNRTQFEENKKRKRKKGKTSNGLTSDSGIGSSAQPSRAHSPEIGNKHRDRNESTPYLESVSQALEPIPSSTADEPELFILDSAPAPIVVEDISPAPDPAESNEDGNELLLPSHVAILRDDGRIPAEVVPPPNLGSDDEEYIEYLDYEDRKVSSFFFF